MANRHRWLVWLAQLVIAGVVVAMVWRTFAANWREFTSLHVALAPKPGWIALSVLTVLATYAIQIESWRRILAGWGQRLAYGRAARIWLLVNLGRYIPGKVWSIAGLIVLAQRAGGGGLRSWRTAAGVFALGYILGLLALFAPGGVVVREVTFIGLLTPALGSGGAVALSVGSRVLLTLTEVAAPLIVLLITGRTKEDGEVRTVAHHATGW